MSRLLLPTLLAAVLVTACESPSAPAPRPPQASARVRAFIDAAGLPEPRDIHLRFADSTRQLAVFLVYYGPVIHGPFGDGRASAAGIELGTRIAWVRPPSDRSAAAVYDPVPADTAVFTEQYMIDVLFVDVPWLFAPLATLLACDPELPAAYRQRFASRMWIAGYDGCAAA
jgi:hypothetical protein